MPQMKIFNAATNVEYIARAKQYNLQENIKQTTQFQLNKENKMDSITSKMISPQSKTRVTSSHEPSSSLSKTSKNSSDVMMTEPRSFIQTSSLKNIDLSPRVERKVSPAMKKGYGKYLIIIIRRIISLITK